MSFKGWRRSLGKLAKLRVHKIPSVSTPVANAPFLELPDEILEKIVEHFVTPFIDPPLVGQKRDPIKLQEEELSDVRTLRHTTLVHSRVSAIAQAALWRWPSLRTPLAVENFWRTLLDHPARLAASVQGLTHTIGSHYDPHLRHLTSLRQLVLVSDRQGMEMSAILAGAVAGLAKLDFLSIDMVFQGNISTLLNIQAALAGHQWHLHMPFVNFLPQAAGVSHPAIKQLTMSSALLNGLIALYPRHPDAQPDLSMVTLREDRLGLWQYWRPTPRVLQWLSSLQCLVRVQTWVPNPEEPPLDLRGFTGLRCLVILGGYLQAEQCTRLPGSLTDLHLCAVYSDTFRLLQRVALPHLGGLARLVIDEERLRGFDYRDDERWVEEEAGDLDEECRRRGIETSPTHFRNEMSPKPPRTWLYMGFG